MFRSRLISKDDFDSNPRISREKAFAVEEYLRYAEATLFNLDHEITRLRSRLDALVSQEREIATRATVLKAYIAPIRRIMPEILQEIFYHCIPTAHNAIMSSREAPLLLGRVCSYWREVAFSTPALWTSLHICIPSLPDTYQTTAVVIREWLDRSGALPLSISIFFKEEECTWSWDIMNTIAEFSARWRRIYLNDEDSLAPPFCVEMEDVPLLEELALVQYGLMNKNISLLSAPLLHRISLPRFGLDIKHYPIRWDILTALDLTGGMYSYNTIRNILNRCPSLEMCALTIVYTNFLGLHLQNDDGDETIVSPHDKIFLPHLRTLHLIPLLYSRIGNTVHFFQTLHVPQLRHLKIKILPEALTQNFTENHSNSALLYTSLYSFLGTLEHGLEELCLIDWSYYSEVMVLDLLKHLPLMRRLSLYSAWCFDDSTLAMFTAKLTDDDRLQCLCPHLEVLHITGASFKPSSLLSFLRSRTLLVSSSKGSRLRKVSISFLEGSEIPGDAVRKKLEMLEKDTGLILDLWYYLPEKSGESQSYDGSRWRDSGIKKFSVYDGLGMEDKCDWSTNGGEQWTVPRLLEEPY